MTKSSSTSLVEDCDILSISYLKNNGFFDGYNTGELDLEHIGTVNIEATINFKESYITISYELHGKHLEQHIKLIKTPCRFGGERYWFICPTDLCANKTTKLYLPQRKKNFACRKCHNLIYRSQKERDKRVDELVKNPDLLTEKAKSGKKTDLFLVLKAVNKITKNEFKGNVLAIKALLNVTKAIEAF